jgi:O-antigen/teichoic acid export membrane protein
MRGLVKNEKDREKFTSSLLTLSIVMILIWFLICCIFKNLFLSITGLNEREMYSMFSIMITSIGFEFWSVYKRVEYDYKKLMSVTLLVSLIQPIVSIFLVLIAKGDKADARISGVMLVGLCIYGPLIVSMLIKGKCFFNSLYWKDAVLFNLPLIPHFLSQTILNHSDRLMINYYIGESEAGIYSLAYSLSMIMFLFNTAINDTLSPWTYQKLKDKNYSDIREIAQVAIMIIAGINLGLILIAPEVLLIFAPKSYKGASDIIPPVAMSVFFLFLYSLFVNIEMYYGKNKKIMIASMAGAIINIVLNMIFIPKFGYIAAGYTTLFSYLIYCLMHAFFTKKIIKEEKFTESCYNFKSIVICSGCFLVIGFILYKLYPHPFVRYGLLVIVCIIVCLNRKYVCDIVKQFTTMRWTREER